MSALNKLMARGIFPPLVHGFSTIPLAAVLIVLPLVLDFDDTAANWSSTSSLAEVLCSRFSRRALNRACRSSLP